MTRKEKLEHVNLKFERCWWSLNPYVSAQPPPGPHETEQLNKKKKIEEEDLPFKVSLTCQSRSAKWNIGAIY